MKLTKSRVPGEPLSVISMFMKFPADESRPGLATCSMCPVSPAWLPTTFRHKPAPNSPPPFGYLIQKWPRAFARRPALGVHVDHRLVRQINVPVPAARLSAPLSPCACPAITRTMAAPARMKRRFL